MFFVLGLCVVLAAMLLLNSIATVAAQLLWRMFGRRITRWSPAKAAHTLFLLRTIPTAFGVGCVLFLFAPAYLTHEPRAGHEEVSLKLALVAAFAALGIGLAIVRGLATWRATSRLTADWLKNAERIKLPKLRLPAYRVEHKFPLIAVVGAVRPRLFIASQVFDSLTDDELSAALDHEVGHILANDNFKRGLMRACRDVLLLVPFGKSLDRAWAETSELAADEYAAKRSAKVGIDLASALVKIARMIPVGSKPSMAAGVFLTGHERPKIFNERVRRLLSWTGNEFVAQSRSRLAFIPKWVPIALTLLVAAVAVRQSHVLATVHALIEHAVYFLE
jgi:Zn-dependent protease with chaperone function